VARTVFLFGLFFSFAFTAFVFPSSTANPLQIKGIMPSSTYSNLPLNIAFSASNLSELPLLFFFSGNVVPASGPPGSLVSMSGRFASGGQIVVYFDDATVMAVAGQKSGDWSASFVVPYVSVGAHTVRAIDVGGRWMSTASFSVTSSGVGFSISSLVLFGFFAVAALSGLVALVLLFVSRGRKRQ
jgi:hypothetical protein